ncbi:MAG: FAD-binding protein, partial [Eubacterium sp.]
YQHITGDALGIAIKQGIELENINYIQIHPTTLYSEKKGRSFLISESVRGEGGVLLNAEGKRFVNELLPRDLLTEAIEIQKKLDHKEFVRLSVVHLGEDVIKNRFPNIYRHCLEEGYDMTKEPIPVTPAQHYFMGGIKVDLDSCTSFKNLYAVGETSCNGVHGANRLASNSLLESLVFAERAADKIAIEPKRKNTDGFDNKEPLKNDFVENDYRAMILEEIKRKDIHFYEQWCNN